MVSRTNLLWLGIYLVTMGALGFGLVSFRSWALSTYDTSAAQQNWQTWSAEVDRQAAGEGPVTRRPLKTATPPAVVLMTDHFAAICGVSLVLSTALFFTLMVMVRGVLKPAAPLVEDSKPPVRGAI